jgi:hypothetical protein
MSVAGVWAMEVQLKVITRTIIPTGAALSIVL